jgi:predicted phage terminase large subunit-like protein
MSALPLDDYRMLLRADLGTFVQRCFAELNPATVLSWNWHIDAIVAKLDACRRGEIRRLIINVPPRSMKSICASVAFPAFLLGHDPSVQIICASYGQDLADKLGRDTRSIMQTGWYAQAFGQRLAAVRPSAQEIATTGQGYRLATSIGGTLTGRGGDFLIIDDPLKPEEAASDTQRERVNEWYDSTVFSRQNDKKRGCIIVIMQRLHEDDLIGHLLERYDWDVLSFPAIAEQDEVFEITTPLGRYTHTRAVGDILHPDREPKEVLDELRRTLGEYNFAGQYQQSPRPFGGGMVKEEWFSSSTDETKPAAFERIIQSWDTASKVTELSDYSVCTTWGATDCDVYYLLDVYRAKLEYPALKLKVKELHARWKPQTVLIEDKASGIQLIQDLRSEGLYAATPYKPQAEKVMRMLAQTPTIEQGKVYLPELAHWRADYIKELTSFPKAKHDDQADSTAQALEWFATKGKTPGLIRFAQQEMAKRRAGQ